MTRKEQSFIIAIVITNRPPTGIERVIRWHFFYVLRGSYYRNTTKKTAIKLGLKTYIYYRTKVLFFKKIGVFFQKVAFLFTKSPHIRMGGIIFRWRTKRQLLS